MTTTENLNQDLELEDAKAFVISRYPTACAVGTLSGPDGSHVRIWPTGGWFETRYIGKGPTTKEAWVNAKEAIENGKVRF